MVIKVILVASIGCLAIFAASARTRASHRAIRRLTLAALLPAGVVAVLFPDTVSYVARIVGVGRGTDLLLYVFVMAFAFVAVSFYQRMLDIEDRYVRLARRVAVDDALRGDPITEPVSAIHERETNQEDAEGSTDGDHAER